MRVGHLEEGRPLAGMSLAEVDARGGVATNQILQPTAAIAKRVAPKITAVELEEIEGEQHQPFGRTPDRSPQLAESVTPFTFWTHNSPSMMADLHRKVGAMATTGLYFSVQSKPLRVKARGPLPSITTLRPIAVVFRLVDPLGAGRRFIDQGRQHRSEESECERGTRHGWVRVILQAGRKGSRKREPGRSAMGWVTSGRSQFESSRDPEALTVITAQVAQRHRIPVAQAYRD